MGLNLEKHVAMGQNSESQKGRFNMFTMVEDVEEPIQLRKVQRLVVPSHVSTAKWIQGHPRPGVVQVWRDAIDLTYGAGGSLDET